MRQICCKTNYKLVVARSPGQSLLPAGNTSMPELHADLCSRHASPLEVYVFVTSTKEAKCYVRRDCHRCDGKHQRRKRGGRNVRLPDWGMNIKRQHSIGLTWVTKIKSLMYGGSLNVVRKVSLVTGSRMNCRVTTVEGLLSSTGLNSS